MSNPAQEEADRILNGNGRQSPTTHPEDHHTDLDSDTDHKPSLPPKLRSRHHHDSSDDDEMITTTTTRQTYIPTTTYHANTGPKGVIADAQNYQRARRSTFRRTITTISDTLSFSRSRSRPSKPKSYNSNSEADISDDDDFLAQWRQQRLAELQDQFSKDGVSSTNPRKQYGSLETVNADGYLNAVEHTPRETNVVVLLNDPDSRESREVEDEVKMLAYRWGHVRFVKLHHEIAEMETVEIPAILAYRGGDVFATISGAEREGLEGVLREQGVLKR